jgi:hypothetical protein
VGDVSKERRAGTEGMRVPGLTPAAALAVLVLLLFCAVTAEPAGQEQIPYPLGRHPSSPFESSTNLDPLLAAKQLRALNAQRQKSMVSDTDKLLKLAQELNTEIETGNRDIELRRITDIEKLARNVKQKMSTSLVGGPSFHEPGPPAIP